MRSSSPDIAITLLLIDPIERDRRRLRCQPAHESANVAIRCTFEASIR